MVQGILFNAAILGSVGTWAVKEAEDAGGGSNNAAKIIPGDPPDDSLRP